MLIAQCLSSPSVNMYEEKNANVVNIHRLSCVWGATATVSNISIYQTNTTSGTIMTAAEVLSSVGKCMTHLAIEEGFTQKRRQRSSLLFGEQNLFKPLPR